MDAATRTPGPARAPAQDAPYRPIGRDTSAHALDEVERARAEQAELARMAQRVGESLTNNTSASQREQGVRDLVAAVASTCDRTATRLVEIMGALVEAGAGASQRGARPE